VRFGLVEFGSVAFCPCKFIKNLLPHGEHKIQIRSANTQILRPENANGNFCVSDKRAGFALWVFRQRLFDELFERL